MTRRRQGPFSLPVPARVTFSYVRTANERLLPLISLHEKYIDNNFSSNVVMWTKQDEEHNTLRLACDEHSQDGGCCRYSLVKQNNMIWLLLSKDLI